MTFLGVSFEILKTRTAKNSPNKEPAVQEVIFKPSNKSPSLVEAMKAIIMKILVIIKVSIL